jgi:hypothetical protein
MGLRHVGFYDASDAPLVQELDAVARERRTTYAQLLRASLIHTLPLLRSGELSAPAPRRVGRRPRTPVTEAR